MDITFTPTPDHPTFEAIASMWNWRIGRWVDADGQIKFTVWHVFSTRTGKTFDTIADAEAAIDARP